MDQGPIAPESGPQRPPAADVVRWLAATPGHRFVPLFDADAELVVRVRPLGAGARPAPARSPEMEAATITLAETGLIRDDWTGLLYVMGWGEADAFRPLYVGKAEREGVRHPLSANLANLRGNPHKFARWGDGLDYHVGDLSHALYGFRAYRPPTAKYRRWAARLFASWPPPVLREPVYLYLVPWYEHSRGPSGLRGSLPAAEKEVIALAAHRAGGVLLNVDGR